MYIHENHCLVYTCRIAYAPYSFFKKQGIKGPTPSAFFGNALQFGEVAENIVNQIDVEDDFDFCMTCLIPGYNGLLPQSGKKIWKSMWVSIITMAQWL